MTVRYSRASASPAGYTAWLRYTRQASRDAAADFLSASTDSLGPASDSGATSCCLHAMPCYPLDPPISCVQGLHLLPQHIKKIMEGYGIICFNT